MTTYTINPEEMHYIHIENGEHKVFRIDESTHTTRACFTCSREELPEHLTKGLAFLLLLPPETEGNEIGARVAEDFFLIL